MVKRYVTVCSVDETKFDEQVEKYLNKGYMLYGNPYSVDRQHAQALVYVEGDAPKKELPPVSVPPIMVEEN